MLLGPQYQIFVHAAQNILYNNLVRAIHRQACDHVRARLFEAIVEGGCNARHAGFAQGHQSLQIILHNVASL